MITSTGNSVGDTATYTCNSGFELVGNANVTCMQVDENSAAYPPVLSLCRREYCMDIARTFSVVSIHMCTFSYESFEDCKY